MKYIVPLFTEYGAINLGFGELDSSRRARIGMRGDRFVGVTWDPWWSERKSEEGRKRQHE